MALWIKGSKKPGGKETDGSSGKAMPSKKRRREISGKY
jgi:hypothetical protein